MNYKPDVSGVSNRQAGTLMVMAGGTGGHVFPALAVAIALREKGTHVTWLGTRYGLEATVVPANQFDIEWVSVAGLRGKGVASWALAPFKLLRAVTQSIGAIRRVRPDCVLGMGGFAAGPGGLAAKLMGKPLLVHEQNAVAGLTNRYLAKIATRVLTGFPVVSDLPDCAEWVGNPVRKNIVPAGSVNDGHKINLLVIGGSQGALSFNKYLAAVFAKQQAELNIWHQSGKGRSAEVSESYKAEGVTARVTDFIEDMAAAYAWADLLICRAGAMTIAECCAAGKPALLIPYPYSAGDHQLRNAEAMVEAGAAQMLSNTEITSPAMIKTLASMIVDRSELTAMGKAALTLHKPDALNSVVGICEEYLHA